MRRFIRYQLLLCIQLAVFSITAFGQGEIDDQQITIVKDRKIELPEAQRPFESIAIEKKSIDVSKQNYSFNDYNLPLPYVDAKLKILSVKDDPIAKLYGNYLKAGFGNYGTSYLEGYLYKKRSANLSYGLNLRHMASSRGPVKNSGLSDNHALAYGKYLSQKFALESELGYYRSLRHFYGYDQNLEVSKDSMKQIFQTVSWKTGIKNLDSTAALNYQATFELAHIRDRFNARETEGLLQYQTKKKLDLASSYGAKGLISVAGRSDSTSFIRNLVSMQPYYQRTVGEFNLTGGINFAYENDTVLAKKNFHLYPSLKAEYTVIEGMLNAYAGLEGNMERNTLRTTTRQNPWVIPRFPISHTNKLLELFIGAQGTVLKHFTYHLSASQSSYRNYPFFINNGKDSLRFTLAYDSSRIQLTKLKADITYNLENKLLAGANVTFQAFHMGTLKEAWHIPVMQANYYVMYYFKEKIIFNLNSYMYSGIIARQPDGKALKLPTILDMNVKVDYLFSKNFSAFLELNNVLANKYQRYLFYQQKGVNFLLGATCSF